GIIAIVAGAPEVGAGLITQSQQLSAATFFTYTRAEEGNADQQAVKYLTELGESSIGLVEFFEKFRGQEVLSARYYPDFLRSHPSPPDRIQVLRQLVADTGLADAPSDPEEMHQLQIMHAKLRGFLDPRAVWTKYPPDDQSEYAVLARSIAAFRNSDFTPALRGMDQLIELEPDNPYYHELKGQILFEKGDVDASVAPNARAAELKPNKPLILLSYARSLLARDDEGDVTLAEDALLEARKYESKNALVYQQLAIVYEKQGLRARAQLATAEEHFYYGDYLGAQRFSQFALQGLEPNTPAWRRAREIAAVTDPRLPENRRRYRR
ncbi:MAG: tetratricopeptide repeat protein, partial [Pseudomonadota bacterium]